MLQTKMVIKLGGSLYPYAREVITTLRDLNPDALIIPGGGIFADAIRATDPGGTPAHWMAIAAMDQYGWFLSSFGIDVSEEPCFTGETRILLPYQTLRHYDPLPHSWEVTSDTIAAWIAFKLKTPLLILKSIDQIRDSNGLVDLLSADTRTGDLDPCFTRYVLENNVSGWIINGTDTARIIMFFSGRQVPGTWFGTILYPFTE